MNLVDDETVKRYAKKAREILNISPDENYTVPDEIVNEYAEKARKIFGEEPNEKIQIPPWNPNNITRATDWFASDSRVIDTIAKHYKIKK